MLAGWIFCKASLEKTVVVLEKTVVVLEKTVVVLEKAVVVLEKTVVVLEEMRVGPRLSPTQYLFETGQRPLSGGS